MTDYFPKKPLDYPAFIDELRELLANSLREESLQWSPDALGFRKWKASLLDLLARIHKAGYTDVRCGVEDRDFRYYGPGDEKYARAFFNKAVDDTNIEMTLIVENFKKHGDPKAAPPEVNVRAGVAAPKPFDYAAFVSEIADLVKRAEKDDEKWCEAPGFRAWKHEVQDNINRIRRLRYPVACGIAQRHLQAFVTGHTRGNPNLDVFNRDMEDTLVELRLIISNFRKFGAPVIDLPLIIGDAPEAEGGKKDEPAAKSSEPVVPDKITIPWLWHNLHWTVTVGAITVIVTVFSAGTVFGGTKAGQTVLSWFSPPPAITTAAPTPPTVKK